VSLFEAFALYRYLANQKFIPIVINLKFLVVAVATTLLFLCSAFTYEDMNTNEPPQVELGISPAELQVYGSISLFFPDFDFDANCQIRSYQVVRVSRRADPVILKNTGSNFNSAVQRIIAQAKFGDTYFFEDIQATCPGDDGYRPIPSIVVKVR